MDFLIQWEHVRVMIALPPSLPPPHQADQLTWSDSQCFPTLLPRPVLSAVVQLPEPGACRVAVSEDDI